MSSVIDLRTYLGASSRRLLVMVDLQEKNYDALARDNALELQRSLGNCIAAIRHAREFAIPIAFTRHGDTWHGDEAPGMLERSSPSPWISGLEPRRSDMVFERQQPSCYSNHLFENVVAQAGSFAIAGLIAEETCLATAIDASRRGHHVTFLSDASASRCRHNADAAAVHVLATQAIELFADVASTGQWLVATSQRLSKGIAMDDVSARRLHNVIPVLVEQRNLLIAGGVGFAGHLVDLAILQLQLSLHDISEDEMSEFSNKLGGERSE
jgi:nicotinamidase-related amidase